jgi:protein-S-isoprenylcysteine O-methyltransferase Ste14
MDDVELLGAPQAWLWLVISATAVAVPALIRGFARRGHGARRDNQFWLQRAPQLAAGINLLMVSAAFEAIEFVLGTGEPAFARTAYIAFRDQLALISLAVVAPPLLAGVVSWIGVAISAAGLILLVSGWLSLGASFSPDAEILSGHQLRQSGPYRFVLHPVYAGLVTFLLGSAVTTLSPVCALITVGVVAPLFLRRAKHEESLLEQEFGAAYSAYAARLRWRRFVPAFLPFGL